MWRRSLKKRNVEDVFSLHSRFLQEDTLQNVTQRNETQTETRGLDNWGKQKSEFGAAQVLTFVEWAIGEEESVQRGSLRNLHKVPIEYLANTNMCTW